MKPRVSICVLIALVALIGVTLAVAPLRDPAIRYRRNHDKASLHAALSRHVANGDSIESIEAVLGRGVVSSDPEMYEVAATLASSNPTNWPQGVLASDEFRRYPSGAGEDKVLQFRKGHLVNFNPRQAQSAGLVVQFGGTVK